MTAHHRQKHELKSLFVFRRDGWWFMVPRYDMRILLYLPINHVEVFLLYTHINMNVHPP